MPVQLKQTLRKKHFFRLHSLSLATLAILMLWIVLYYFADPTKHLGSFYGNAIADWSGSLVLIVATKIFFERRSEESKPLRGRLKNKVRNFLRDHSLSIFLVITGLLWLWLYARMDANSKWGQVVGNIVSEWVQALGLVLMTKCLFERGSRESREC